jgi:uncharacterized protein YgiM (DUF1202 family)
MKRTIYVVLSTFIAVSFLLAACGSPTATPTTQVQLPATETQQTLPTTAPPTNTAVPTNTQSPTNTPLPTEAFTPTQPPASTDTPTPVPSLVNTPPPVSSGVTATINENTNCRTGPTADYTVVVVFMSGEQAKITSSTTLPDYVLVEDPNNPGQSCWLWTQYVTINGDIASLPVATPPPPLVNFTVAFTLVQNCSGYSMEFKVVNTGQKTLQAYTVVAKDLTSHTQQTTSSTVFDYRYECAIKQAISYIDPGKAGYVYADNFTYNPAGHSIEATITICSHNDMTGVCVTQVVRFTP